MIVIIGILAAVVIVAYTGIAQRAHNAKSEADATAIRHVASTILAETGVFPTAVSNGNFDPSTNVTRLPPGIQLVQTVSAPSAETIKSNAQSGSYFVYFCGPGTGVQVFYTEGNTVRALDLGTGCLTDLTPIPTNVIVDSYVDGGEVDNNSSASITWQHSSTPGAYVMVFLQHHRENTDTIPVTYNGSPMPRLSTQTFNSNTLEVFGLFDATGGSKTIVVPQSSGQSMRYGAAASISFNNVSSVGSPSYTTGTGQSTSVSNSSGSLTVQSYGTYNQTHTFNGGTNVVNHLIRGGVRGQLTVQYTSAASETFTGTATSLVGVTVRLDSE